MFTLFKKKEKFEVFETEEDVTIYCEESGMVLEHYSKDQELLVEPEKGLATALRKMTKEEAANKAHIEVFGEPHPQVKKPRKAWKSLVDYEDENRYVNKQGGIFIKDPTRGFDLVFDFDFE